MKVAVPSPGLFGAALWLLLSAAARAQDADAAAATDVAMAADKPYATIVARNMFGLLPIPPPDTNPPVQPVEPPPKITLNGIMTIFGRDQALFKVATKPKPNQPAKEDTYVLAEGERQEDIEVKKIDHQANKVTFDNHGVMQEIDLTEAGSTGGGGGAGAAPGGGPGNAMANLARAGAMDRFNRRFPGVNPGTANVNPNVGNPNAGVANPYMAGGVANGNNSGG